MNPTRNIVAMLCCALALFSLAGCDKYAKDKKDIAASWETLGKSASGAQVAGLVSQKTLDYYTRLMKNVLDSPAKDVWDFPPGDMRNILRIRNRCKRSEIKAMDGKAYVAYAADHGWRTEDSDNPDYWKLTEIKVSGDRATATVHNPSWEAEYERDQFSRSMTRSGLRYMPANEKPARYPVDLYKEDGVWKIDETSMFPQTDKEIRAMAKDERMSIRDFIMAVESIASGQEVKMSAWDPMRK